MEGKGNDGKGNIPERDLWETEQTFWDKLDKQYGFGFDCCANHSNTKCVEFSDDFLKRTFVSGVAWMNPPFSKALEMFDKFFDLVRQGVAIFRCDNMETKVWQSIILEKADWIFIPKGRVPYTPFDVDDMRNGMGTRFPSALIGIGVDTPKDFEGRILFTTERR